MPVRNRRNASERKCLSPQSKILFARAPKAIRKAVLEAEQSNKKSAPRG